MVPILRRLAAVAFIACAASMAHAYPRFCTTHDTLAFGNRAVGSRTTAIVTVSNCGDEPWRFTDVSVHAATGAGWSLATTCATARTLAPGEACRVDVAFAPAAAGQTSGALWLRQTSTTPDQLITFYGRGIAPDAGTAAIRFVPSLLDFGRVDTGAPAGPVRVALTNVGTATLVPSALVIHGPSPYDFGTISFGDPLDCAVGRAVAPGASCTLNLTFRPAHDGTRQAQLVVDAPQLASLAALPLRGEGASTDAGSIEAIEFFHAARNHYFVTTVAEEAANIDAGGVGPGWVRTGARFRVWPLDGAAPQGAASVCRFFGTPGRGPEAHFFTGDAAECTALRGSAFWIDEGHAFRALLPSAGACPAGLDAVVRLYWPGRDATELRHRYVVDTATVATMVRDGWTLEGPVFCSPRG